MVVNQLKYFFHNWHIRILNILYISISPGLVFIKKCTIISFQICNRAIRFCCSPPPVTDGALRSTLASGRFYTMDSEYENSFNFRKQFKVVKLFSNMLFVSVVPRIPNPKPNPKVNLKPNPSRCRIWGKRKCTEGRSVRHSVFRKYR
jgi:hypothetical protein